VNGLYHPVQLPGLRIRGNLFLAPIAGYTDAAFRSICLEHGADFCFSEMVSAEGIARGGGKSFALLTRSPVEEPWGVQLFGADPDSLAAAVRAIEPLRPSVYDLNCGCSVPKVLKAGAGAALLRDPERIARLVAAMRSETTAPVSVKLRSGWDRNSLNYLETGAAAQTAGASLVSLHPRTRSQGFSGTSEWEHIARLKSALAVPVLGSGDLFSPQDARSMLSGTGCDGLMFARGALGNPFIFSRTRAVLLGGQEPAPEPVELRLQVALEQLGRAAHWSGEALACREMRKHFGYYTRGIPGGAALRRRFVAAASFEEYESIVKEYLARSDGLSNGIR
jgi:tRNA-dihydrouridine synthase B